MASLALQLKPFSYRELVHTVEDIRDRYLEPLQLPKAA
jgi:hypothetical protein